MPRINGTWRDDTLVGGSGNDTIRGQSGNDSLLGGAGDDEIRGDDGNDTLDGGAGDDELDGGSQNDVIFGGDGNDEIDGGSGADTIDGGAGDDEIDGGSQDDLIFGGDGNDTIDGESGADTIEAGAGDDLIEGASQDDVIWGGDGDDTIEGDSGGDLLSGGQGDDLLEGGSQNDSLFGGAGNDTLIGGSDNDWMEGGAGDDLIVAGGYGGGSDTIIFGPGMGNDTIDGFNPATDFLYVQGVDRSDIVLTATGNPRVWVMTINGVPDTSLTLDFRFYWDANVNVAALTGRVLTDGQVTPPEDPYAEPICLTAGVRVETARGLVPAAALRPGDLLRTLDAGFQPVRAVLRRWFPATEIAAEAALRPVRIAAGALGGGLPWRDMHVSLQHCFLAADPAGGLPEALVRARHLADMLGVADIADAAPGRGETYVHLLLDAHQLIRAEGVWTETIFAGPRIADEDPVLARMLGGRRLPRMEARVRPALTRRDLRGFANYVIGRTAAEARRRAA